MTATLSDGAALLRAIIDEPDDDLVRLAYADWLDEGGRTERARLIRLQIALSCDPRVEHLRHFTREEKDLLSAVAVPLVSGWDVCHVPGLLGATPHRAVIFRRGFVESVRCRLQDWLGHGPAIAQAHPVRRVELTDRRPHEERGRWHWTLLASDERPAVFDLPGRVWAKMRGERPSRTVRVYRSEEAALADASGGLIRWARSVSL